MSAKTKIEITCDLCKWPAKIFDSEKDAKSKGYIKVGYESYFSDRDFYYSWICCNCVKTIKAILKNEN